MRNMSFFLTVEQVRRREKTVTRRLGRRKIQVGETRMPVVKCQGIPKGGHVEYIDRDTPILVTGVSFEDVDRMAREEAYGRDEVIKEGFPKLTPADFVAMFCEHNRCSVDDVITRIEFKYIALCIECRFPIAEPGLCGECSCEDDCAP